MADGAKEAAVALKVQGNKAFVSHDWNEALALYTKAIETYDKDPSFFCNRAQVCSIFVLVGVCFVVDGPLGPECSSLVGPAC